jgi:hypothetical protein
MKDLVDESRNRQKIIQIETVVPAIMELANEFAKIYLKGTLNEFEFNQCILDKALQPEIMNSIEYKIPGWKEMAEHKDHETLIHVFRTFVALLINQEFQTSAHEQKALIKWAVALHDIAKHQTAIINGKYTRDSMHPFRSAVMAARILPSLGFSTMDKYKDTIEKWSSLVLNAKFPDTRPGQEGNYIPDNSKIVQINNLLEEMFGRINSALTIIKVILLHSSLNLVEEWPSAAPLNEEEIKYLIDIPLLRLLRLMTLSDSAAWQNPTINAKYTEEIEHNLEKIEKMIASAR